MGGWSASGRFQDFLDTGSKLPPSRKMVKTKQKPKHNTASAKRIIFGGDALTKVSHFGGDRDQRSGRRLRETTWKTSFCLAVKSIVFLAPKNVFGNCVSFGGQKCNFSRTKKNVLGNYVLAARNANAKLTCSPRINVIQKTIF